MEKNKLDSEKFKVLNKILKILTTIFNNNNNLCKIKAYRKKTYSFKITKIKKILFSKIKMKNYYIMLCYTKLFFKVNNKKIY